jgi:hypothetical protein
MTFKELEALRRTLRATNLLQIESLKRYFDPASNGFGHQLNEPKLSMASTATCVLSLVATARWRIGGVPWEHAARPLAEAMLRKDWKSAGLPPGNAFTTSFVLECVTALEPHVEPPSLNAAEENATLLAKAESILLDAVKDGGARILKYPPSTYLTQLIARTLKKRGKVDGVADKILGFAWRQVADQLALLMAASKTADPYQLAYGVVLIVSLADPSKVTPDQARMLNAALAKVFESQLPDGSWPRSRPLFHYQEAGSAYCYEYEMLVQLIEAFQNVAREDRLLPFLSHFERAVNALKPTSYPLSEKAVGWSSGHHPQLEGPESWSTASVFHFTHALDRLLAEAIRQTTFEYLDAVYAAPRSPKNTPAEFAPNFLDSSFEHDSKTRSLRDVVLNQFVVPLAKSESDIRNGGSASDDTATSMILFGPPGTSKTELSKRIAEYLGWPRLTVDPSHFVRNGLDRVQAEANTLFSMLEEGERIVVLFDEFDEMVRERQGANDVLSRFLTTSMLPKLSAINKQRKIVFIVATNHIENFDLAISRTGRFDLILPVLPPSADEKLRHWVHVKKKLLDDLKINPEKVAKKIGYLTFDEFRAIVPKLLKAKDESGAMTIMANAAEQSTWNSLRVFGDSKSGKWSSATEEQMKTKVRLFGDA